VVGSQLDKLRPLALIVHVLAAAAPISTRDDYRLSSEWNVLTEI